MMGWLAGAAGLSFVLVLSAAGTSHADVYLYRDRFGVLHFTNAPTAARSTILFRDYEPASTMVWPRVSATHYDGVIRDIAARYGVEYALVKAVIRAESAFNHRAISPKGALGLMQLMPETAALHRVHNVFAPSENIEGGVKHLRMLLDRYGGNLTLALAAYNAGVGAVKDAGYHVPAYPETREYVRRVLTYRVAYMREGSIVSARAR
jgi:soluble lytic murein transglycosylase-like protein